MIADGCAAWIRHALRKTRIDLVREIIEEIAGAADQRKIVIYAIVKLQVDERFSPDLLTVAALVYGFAIEVWRGPMKNMCGDWLIGLSDKKRLLTSQGPRCRQSPDWAL